MQEPSNTTSMTPLVALLAAADCSQAAFARLTGITTRQINAWCRDQAATPRWALILATILQQHSPDALTMALEEALYPPAPPSRTLQRPPDD
jgi:DNA-binding transcriptional regulator YiaG